MELALLVVLIIRCVSLAPAAAAGVESTRGMVARAGRARCQGEKSIGHVDAGAASVALIFQVLAEG